MSTPRNISLAPPSRDLVLKVDPAAMVYSVTADAVRIPLTQKMAEELYAQLGDALLDAAKVERVFQGRDFEGNEVEEALRLAPSGTYCECCGRVKPLSRWVEIVAVEVIGLGRTVAPEWTAWNPPEARRR